MAERRPPKPDVASSSLASPAKSELILFWVVLPIPVLVGTSAASYGMMLPHSWPEPGDMSPMKRRLG